MVRAARNSGLTIIELLVVVAIIGVLVALLLPAVQSARESSRKSACKNNLRQIGLGILQYSTNKANYLPASWRDVHDQNGKPAKVAEYAFYIHSFSWRATILPYLGEQALYDRLDFTSTPIATRNAPLTAQVVNLFQCPSTFDAPRLAFPQDGNPDVGMGANDYVHVFFVGQEQSVEPNQISGKQIPGAWYALSTYKPSTLNGEHVAPDDVVQARGSAPLRLVTDGLSKTILCAEKAGFPNTYLHHQVVPPSPWAEGVWAAGEDGAFGKASVNWANWPSVFSFHNAGAHVAMCDGAVVLLSDDTDPDIVVAMCSRSGGETQ